MLPGRHIRKDTPPWYPGGIVGRHIYRLYTREAMLGYVYQVIHQRGYAGYSTPYHPGYTYHAGYVHPTTLGIPPSRVYTGCTPLTPRVYTGVHPSHPGYTSVLGRMRHNEARLIVRLCERMRHNEARLMGILWGNEAQRGASYPLSMLLIPSQRGAFCPPSLGETGSPEAQSVLPSL